MTTTTSTDSSPSGVANTTDSLPATVTTHGLTSIANSAPPTETISLNHLFDRMTTQELEAYAQTGTLPGWFQAARDGKEGTHDAI